MSEEKKSNVSPSKGRAGGRREGAGRPKGSLDKGNALIREMVAEALDKAGGVEYLVTQAHEKPVAFLGLIGKVLPIQVSGVNGDAIQTVTKIVLADMDDGSDD